MRLLRRRLALPVALLALGACSPFVAEEANVLSAEQMAVLKGAPSTNFIKSVQSRSGDAYSAVRDGNVRRLVLAPGTYSIAWSLQDERGTIITDLYPGRKYELRIFFADKDDPARGPNIYTASVLEADTGYVMAGSTPPWRRDSTTYIAGLGYLDDTASAQEYQQMAADGDAAAQYRLYTISRRPAGFKWLCLAAAKKYPPAQESMGITYWFGNAPASQQDRVLGYMWFRLAADNGAAVDLDKMRSQMTAAQIDEGERLAQAWEPEPAACEATES